MLSYVDDRVGLIKTSWSKIRNRVQKVAAEFATLVDELSLDDNYPLYLAYYPYGDLIGDTVSPIFPKSTGGTYRLSDRGVPKEVIKHLGYGQDTLPLGLLLEQSIEYFIDIKKFNMAIPWQIYSPGSFFPLARFVKNKSNRMYSPNGVLSTVSGSRSVFMLPRIGSSPQHLMLRRHFKQVKPKPPTDLVDHWHLFKDITNSTDNINGWRTCILYFSSSWIEKIQKDKAWLAIKNYLLELAVHNFDYEKNKIYYDIAYSLIQYGNNLKPNPYLLDTACHLFAIAAGAVPGFSPADNEHSLPLSLLQKAFVENYSLKKYLPTIMQPYYFKFDDIDCKPVYYSLNYPSTLPFSPKSRKDSSTIFEMDELMHIIKIFQAELSCKNNILSDTIISQIAEDVEFKFFHNNKNIAQENITDSEMLINSDNRFSKNSHTTFAPNAEFSSDAPFLRGCISIARRSN